jgi:hypothetical protein
MRVLVGSAIAAGVVMAVLGRARSSLICLSPAEATPRIADASRAAQPSYGLERSTRLRDVNLKSIRQLSRGFKLSLRGAAR